MNSPLNRSGSSHVAPTTRSGPDSTDWSERHPGGIRLRDAGWVSAGVFLGGLLCDSLLGPALASGTVRPGDLASLAVFAMLFGSVRDRPVFRPVNARLPSTVPSKRRTW